MGGGASKSSGKLTLVAEKENDDLSNALFDELAGTDGKLHQMELHRAVIDNNIHGWELEGETGIKATFKLFDTSGDGYLDRTEFKNALDAMDKKQNRKGSKKEKANVRSKTERPGLKKSFTFRNHRQLLEDAEEEQRQLQEEIEKAKDEEAKALAAQKKKDNEAVLNDEAFKLPTLEEREKAHWDKCDKQKVWEIALMKRMPWNREGENQLLDAIAHARAMGKTPLLLDQTKDAMPKGDGQTNLDRFFIERKAEVLDAVAMNADVKTEKRGKPQVMKEARKQLVAAMKNGVELYVQMKSKAVVFTGEGSSDAFTAEDTLPRAIFDARQLLTSQTTFVDQSSGTSYHCLAPYVAGSAACEERKRNDTMSTGLRDSSHPLSKVVYEADHDPQTGHFYVKEGFGVCVCTTFTEDIYADRLGSAVPMMRFQVMKVNG